MLLSMSEPAIEAHSLNTEPIGISVVRQMRIYIKGLLPTLRFNFECLLKMMFESEGVQGVLESLFHKVETRRACTIKNSFTCIESDEVDMMFIKGNIRLVADV